MKALQQLGSILALSALWILNGCGSPSTSVSVTPPTQPDTVTSATTHTFESRSAGYAIDYRVNSQWGSGFTADVTIRNLGGSAISGWTLQWVFPNSQTQITNLWNGQLTQSGSNVSVQNLGWNATIPAGGSVNFGFQASYPGGSQTTPVEFVLNGSPTSLPTPTPAPLACLVDYSVSSSWNEGFVANLNIRNLGGSITGWELGFDFPVDGVTITNLWNGSVTQTGRTVKVKNLDWNKTINQGGSASLGFQASRQGGSVTATGFSLNGVPCTGQPATPVPSPTVIPSPTPTPVSSPSLSPSPSPSPLDIPNNSAVIIDADTLDGKSYKVGQSIEFRAAARDSEGNDISSQIEWIDAQGRPLGTGSSYTFQATKPQMVTIAVRIPRGQPGVQARLIEPSPPAADPQCPFLFPWDAMISFTVSSPGADIAPNVKVLSPRAENVSVSLPLEGTGRIVIDNLCTLLNIRNNDVLVGIGGTKLEVTDEAEGQVSELNAQGQRERWVVPPLKLSNYRLEYRNGKLYVEAGARLAEPKEVIEAGSGALSAHRIGFTVGRTFRGDFNIPIAELNVAPTSRKLDFPKEWEFFKETNLTTSYGLSANVLGNYKYNPAVEVVAEFNKNNSATPSGLERFSVKRTGDIEAKIALQLSGFFELTADLTKDLWVPPKFTYGPAFVGPVPFWVDFVLTGKLELANNLRIGATGGIGLTYTQTQETPEVWNYINGEWSHTPPRAISF